MFCNACGKTIPNDSEFCPECGVRLSTLDPPHTPRPPGPGPTVVSDAPSVSTGLNVAIIVATLVIPFVGLVMGAIYLANADPQKKSAGKVWLWVGIAAFLFWLAITLGY